MMIRAHQWSQTFEYTFLLEHFFYPTCVGARGEPWLVEALQKKPAYLFFIPHPEDGTDDIIEPEERDSAFRGQVG